MNISRVESATEADWDFVIEDGDLHQACKLAARKASREFEAVDFEDAYQNAILFLAVRPELQARYGEFDSVGHFSQQIYSHALREPAIADSNQRSVTVSREALEAFEIGGDL